MKYVKNFSKVILKVFSTLLAIILTVLLIVNIFLFSVRLITEEYFKENTIKDLIYEVNIIDFIETQSSEGENIKDELVDDGIPIELLDEILKNEQVSNFIFQTISSTIDYIIYDKKDLKISSDDIYAFFDENYEEISTQLKENNVEHSELLTIELKEEILTSIKESSTMIDETINDALIELDTSIEKEYKIGSYNISSILDIIQFVYSSYFTTILIISIILISLLIILVKFSFIKGLRWIQVSFILSGILLLIIGIVSNNFITNFIINIPLSLKNFILTSFKVNFIKYGAISIVIGIILLTLSIILKKKKYNIEEL